MVTAQKARHICFTFFFIALALCHTSLKPNRDSLAKNDAFPVFTSIDPQEFLLTRQKLELLGDDDWDERNDHLNLSISLFGQNANRGKPLNGFPFPLPVTIIVPDTTPTTVALGDLTGGTGMIALLYGTFPQGVTSFGPQLLAARENIFGTIFPGTQPIPDDGNNKYIDPKHLFGFYSIDLSYRKRGIAFDLYGMFSDDFGFRLQTRVAANRQNVTALINGTDDPVTGTPTDFFPANVPQDLAIQGQTVDTYLMDVLFSIADEIGVNLHEFTQTSIEAIYISLFWRHLYNLNEDKYAWPHLFLTPYLELIGSVSPGKAADPSKQFAVYFGNNQHSSIGFTGGLCFDFVESIEISGEVGYMHFFGRDIANFRVPNSTFQTYLYPYATDVHLQPGANWHFAGKIAAYHFLDMLSMYFEYIIVEHKNDHITIKNGDPAFVPEALEKVSTFKTKLANIGINYDFSPNMSLGFLWQAPLSQRNTYRSTTLLFCFNAVF
jgi:hypothetical protein